MRAVSYSATGQPPTLGPWPDPVCPDDGVVVRVGATGRVPLRLARLAGPRPGAAAARARSRAGRDGGRGGPRGPAVGRRRPGHRAVRVRLRPLRVVRGRRHPGVPRPDPAGLHRAGVVRRAGGTARRRHQPGPAARRPRRRDRRVARLPARDRLPRARHPRPGRRRGLGRGARLRRRRAVGGDGRRPRSAPASSPSTSPRPRWPAARARRHRDGPRRRPGGRGPRADRRRRARLARRRRFARDGRRLGPLPAAAAVVTSRSGCCSGDASTPPLPMDLVVARELSVHGSHGMPAHQYPDLLALVADGALDPGLLVGRSSASTRRAPRWPRWTSRPPRPG